MLEETRIGLLNELLFVGLTFVVNEAIILLVELDARWGSVTLAEDAVKSYC